MVHGIAPISEGLRKHAIMMCLKCADISNPARPWPMYVTAGAAAAFLVIRCTFSLCFLSVLALCTCSLYLLSVLTLSLPSPHLSLCMYILPGTWFRRLAVLQ